MEYNLYMNDGDEWRYEEEEDEYSDLGDPQWN